MDTTHSFGYWIRRRRKALDLTQQGLAEQVGCSLAAIKKIERDERRPSRQIAERMAHVLGVPAERRDIYMEVARGLRPVDQLSMGREPLASTRLPTGIVTFLFTDIEGSTRLWEQHPQGMPVAHARHDQILRDAIHSSNGYVFREVGDGFCAAFVTAAEAVQAAVKAQLDLQAEEWGKTPIHVRMGIHTGNAELQEDGHYQGYVTLSQVQRVMSVAHSGQVLLTSMTQQLVQEKLPTGVKLLDAGQYQFKDASRPVALFQLAIDGLPSDFPPLRIAHHNLPVQLTSFVGREKELAEVNGHLKDTHLLTLTGPGGTGKTRLALQLAAEVLETFPDGVWLVELAPLADPTLIVSRAASALGVREQPRRTILEVLTDHVRHRNMLLVLDNCEHLIESCARLAEDLLRAAPHLKILTTSREALGIDGETTFRVPSFPLPDTAQSQDLAALARNDSVQLFVDRAVSASPDFQLGSRNAPAVVEICRRLDGIPLAIELAAARTRVFPPEEIAARLDDRFRLLTGGSRTALERHQTLFALIDWSHNLLSIPERAFLRRLSVFSGGWTFGAAEAVCAEGLEAGTLELLSHLVDKSLVAFDEQAEAGRYRLSETIRQFARDRLLESSEAEPIRDRHFQYFLDLAEAADPKLRTRDQLEWLDRLDTEHDNFQTALAWSMESGRSDKVMQLAGALQYYWVLRGSFLEGRKWLDGALEFDRHEQSKLTGAGNPPLDWEADARRARVLYGAAWIRMGDMNFDESRQNMEASLRIWRELGDKWWMASALVFLGLVHSSVGEIQEGVALDQEAVALARQVEDPWLLGMCLIRLGDDVKLTGKDLPAARRFLEEGVALARTVGDLEQLSEGLRELGSTNYGEGRLPEAAAAIEAALTAARELGGFPVTLALAESAIIACLQNDPARAKRYALEVCALARDTNAPFVIIFALIAFGISACFGGEPERGTRQLAALERHLIQSGANFFQVSTSPLVKVGLSALEKAKAQLGPAGYQAARAEGEKLTLEQALALAVENEDLPNR